MFILVVLYQTMIQTYVHLGCAVSNKDTDLCLSWLCCIKQRYKPMFILVVLYQTKIQTYVHVDCVVSNKDTDLCLSCLCCIKQRYKPMFILVVLYQTKIETYVNLGCAASNLQTHVHVGSDLSNKHTNLCLCWLRWNQTSRLCCI